ncbi:histidine kinase dimerization/phospho-acceptor domain-containing protein [Metabacillus sp. Hm71]|uniref:HAMP domain-containing sensor histidine kinase n=1 Tax=Metabacillus sp. Hm71 TaxID=3450743 RepID=UPI003F41BC67
MDTKWKSRIAIVTWFILLTFGISGVLTALVNDENDYMKQSYFNTSQFEDTLGQLFMYINAFEISYEEKAELKKSITVSDEEIEEYRFRYGDLTEQITSIEQQYQSRIDEAQANEDQKVADIYIKERDKKIEDITKNFESDEYIKEKIVKEKEQKIDEYYKELEGYRHEYEKYKEAFVYYLKNTTTGEVYTNLPSKESKSVETYINNDKMIFIQSYPTKNQSYLSMREQPLISGYEEVMLNNLNNDSNALYEGKIGISNDTPNSNFIMVDYYTYDNQQKVFWVYTIASVIALIVSIIIGKKTKIFKRTAPKMWEGIYNKIPIDVAMLLFGITAIITMVIIVDQSYLGYSYQLMGILEIIFYQLILMTIFFALTVIQGIYLYSRFKALHPDKDVWKSTLFFQFFKMISNAFLNRRIGTQVFLLLAIVFSFGAGSILIFVEPVFLLGYVPAFFLVAVPIFILIIKRTGYFNEISNNAHALANGDFQPDLKVVGRSVFARLAEDINTMKRGVKTSQKAQAKSERLKTELITNVSHDLRTPLTSIITYSELLKNQKLTEDERKMYIEIIDRKSKRLKVLIDDLFEASKMASGNIELVKEKIDLVQLLQQALAESNEAIQASRVQFRVVNPDNPVYAFVDGQKLWRVFDNLIGNILKYSLEHTRAYITISAVNGEAMITFKNISKYELNDDVNELFERFKRGDKSRHTEGSGLGLAIAKSIIDLHEGSLDINVDGDLFKVTIVLGLMQE